MFNLLRMDLYRMKRSKSLYVCLGLLLMATVVCYVMLWLLGTPEGRDAALRIGMLTSEEAVDAADNIMNDVDTLNVFREIGLDGGFYSVTFGVWVMLFVCMDYQSGFVKNVMALHQNRWVYVLSKLMTAAIVDILYLIVQLAFVLLLNRLFGNMLPYAKAGDILFYMSWAWLLTTAFAGLVILVCVCTRSTAAGALATVLLGGGAIVVPLYAILDNFHAGEWLKYSIYMSLAMGPSRYGSLQDLRVFATGVVFLVLYPLITGLVLKKQDI